VRLLIDRIAAALSPGRGVVFGQDDT
jgi:hypothetical protein